MHSIRVNHDFRLVSGAVLFGTGWGATGLCPGPMFVAVVADPTAGGPSLCALFLLIGMLVESRLRAQKGEGLEAAINPRVGISNLSRLGISEVARKNLFLDVRSADDVKQMRKIFERGRSRRRGKNDALPISTVSAALKGKDRAIIFCKSGRRAGKAREYLVSKGLLPDSMEVVCCSMNDLKDAAPAKYVHARVLPRHERGRYIQAAV